MPSHRVVIKTIPNLSVKVDEVDCDLYRILAGDKQAKRLYCGEYLREYGWAEERNAQLHFMLLKAYQGM